MRASFVLSCRSEPESCLLIASPGPPDLQAPSCGLGRGSSSFYICSGTCEIVKWKLPRNYLSDSGSQAHSQVLGIQQMENKERVSVVLAL